MEQTPTATSSLLRGDIVIDLYSAAEDLLASEDFSGEVIGVDLDSLVKLLDHALTSATNTAELNGDADEDQEVFRAIVNHLQLVAFTTGMLFAQKQSGAIPDAQVVIDDADINDFVRSLFSKGVGTIRFIVDGEE